MTCLFCRIIARELPSAMVFEDDRFVAFEDIHPQAPMHVLIVPKEHIPTLNDLEDRHDELVGGMLRLAAAIARDNGLSEIGYRTVFNCQAAAGQTVFHVHLHVLGGRTLTWPPG